MRTARFAVWVLSSCAVLVAGCGRIRGDRGEAGTGDDDDGGSSGLVSIAISPVDPAVFVGTGLAFSATGTWDDSTVTVLTTAVTWASTDESVATVSAAGAAFALAAGSAGISASIDAVVSEASILTVLPGGSGGPELGFVLNGSGAAMHAGRTAMLRFKSGSSVHACVTGTVAFGGSFTLSSAGGLTGETTYDAIELVLDLGVGGSGVYDAGQDHAYSHAALTPAMDVVLSFNHASPAAGGWSGPGPITWTDGTGCPGE